MKTKIATIVIFVLAFTTIVITRNDSEDTQLSRQQISELEEKERRKTITLRERAQLAKARGEKKVILPAVSSLYMEAASPDELRQRLPEYTVVTAELVGRKSYLQGDGSIRSWYKFRVVDTLSQVPPLPFLAPTTDTVHEELIPLRENEFVINRPGGRLTIDGMEIVQREHYIPDFGASQRYLLLLSFDAPRKIGEIILGSQSILPINPDSTVNAEHAEHMLQRTIVEHYGGAVGQLKQALQ